MDANIKSNIKSNKECGSRQSKSAPITCLHSLSKLEMIDILLNKYQMSKQDLLKSTRKELCLLLFKKNYSKAFYDSPLKNTRNSCYIDASLLALLHPIVTLGVSNFWYKSILRAKADDSPIHSKIRIELQKILLNIRTSFRGSGYVGGLSGNVTNLRKLFASYKVDNWNQTQQNEWLHTQMDPIDVIGMLEHVFDIPDRNIFSSGFFRDGKPKKDERVGLVGCPIMPYMLKKADKSVSNLSDFLPIYREETVDRRLKKTRFLYVHIYRNVNGSKTTKPFIAPMKINGLLLVSAIIHMGSSTECGHYVSMLKIGKDQWVYCDDMVDKMEVFHESKFYTHKGGMVKTSGVGFLYVPEHSISKP